MSLARLLEVSRGKSLRSACAETLAGLFPDVTVRSHIGKLDISDLLNRDFINAPAILVAVTRVRTEDRMSHDRDLPVQLTAYIIVEDTAVGDPPLRFARDEVGYALGDALLAALRTDTIARWGLEDIGYPDSPELVPTFTMATFERGTAVYAVSWMQTLYNCHNPFMDMESGLGDVTVGYPGDTIGVMP
jgi:hypothetical protein